MAVESRLTGALAGRYTIRREIGRGGMGSVYLADDHKLDRQVAVKVLRSDIAASLGADRFLREIDIAAHLNHPHIVPLFDKGEAEGFLYYVMQYVEGESLRERLDRDGRLSVDEAIRITRHVTSALAYAHQHGVIHRDIKPDNVLLAGGEAQVADFGVARAVTKAGAETLTSTGIAVGTPQYMSPEQAAGDSDLDARSDVYSVGCLLYEMLTGEPPFAGPTYHALMAAKIQHRPPSVREARRELSIAIDDVVRRALAPEPAQRFESVEELADSLGELATTERRVEIRRWLFVTGALVVGAALAFLLPRLSILEERVDPGIAAVLSFLGQGGEADALGTFEREFVAGLEQVPNYVRVYDRRLEALPASSNGNRLDDWAGTARELRAGEAILLRAEERRDSAEVLAERWDVEEERRIAATSVTISLSAAEAVLEDALGLVERLMELPTGALPAGSRSLDAARAFVAGYRERDAWELAAAESSFRRAIELDPEFPRANYWWAQIQAWTADDDGPDAWLGAARKGDARRALLRGRREASLARALVALGEKRNRQACASYDSLIARDSLDHVAWFGRGQCHARDDALVTDTASPSGWSFRSSYQAAVDSYMRAFELRPALNFAFGRDVTDRLAGILYAQPNKWRPGRPLGDTGQYVANVALDADTLAFTPWPREEVMRGEPHTTDGTENLAVLRNRERLLEVVRRWAAEYDDRAVAQLALARALEAVGSLASSSTELSALDAARRAASLAVTGRDSLDALVVEVRILLKLGRFGEARDGSKAILRRWVAPTPRQAEPLSSLAALIGRPHQASQLARLAAPLLTASPDPRLSGLPLNLLEARQAFLGYAAVGAPAESVGAHAGRLEAVLQRALPPQRLDDAACIALWQPLGNVLEVLRRDPENRRCWVGASHLAMQHYLLVGHRDSVFATMARLDSLRSGELPGSVAFDRLFQEARILAEAGDSAHAARHLDEGLDALANLFPSVLEQPTQAGGLVRAMILRAELSAAEGDTARARRHGAAVAALWRDAAVAELREIRDKMSALGEGER